MSDTRRLARRRAQNRASSRTHRDGIKRIVREAKDRPCADCQAQYPYYVMDLDHVRGRKLFALSTRCAQYGEKAVRAEIAKCEVRCANCHRLRHPPRSKRGHRALHRTRRKAKD